jgi:bacteriophage exclusion system BrxA-like protein
MNKDIEKKYKMSFTAGGILYQESITLAALYYEQKDWSLIHNQVLEQNLLQTRTQNSAKRVLREITQRLKLLTDYEIQLLVNGSRHEQNQILWYAICQLYQFIHDFAVEVIREKFLQMNLKLTQDDYAVFFNHKAEWHEELEKLKNSTQNKLRQVLFKMLREADLLSTSGMINPCLLTPQIVKLLGQKSLSALAIFPISDTDIKALAK